MKNKILGKRGKVRMSAPTSILSGKVVSVADGDTLAILVGVGQHKIRLHGIDTPERGEQIVTSVQRYPPSQT